MKIRPADGLHETSCLICVFKVKRGQNLKCCLASENVGE